MIQRFLPVALAGVAFISACTTTPPPEPQGPPPESVIAEALIEADPYRAEARLSTLLARTDITTQQRADALYHRAGLRRLGAENRLGAADDYTEMLALAPDHALSEKARLELDYTREDIASLQAGLQRIMNLPNWFESAWVLGRHEEAAARYQRSGISPTPTQVAKLRARGFICGAEGEGGPVHQLGDERTDLEGVTWCRSLLVSEQDNLLSASDETVAAETGS